jgi:phosphatidylcholine synthase
LILGFSIVYLCYYFGLSFYLSAKMPEARRLEQEATEQPEA